ncbi:MAG: hypothetical protein M1827_004196 [Pycnora praestabilis]|nr:MAG: hypothetical protein M1827_004196 [Pycnora praestabilis]
MADEAQRPTQSQDGIRDSVVDDRLFANIISTTVSTKQLSAEQRRRSSRVSKSNTLSSRASKGVPRRRSSTTSETVGPQDGPSRESPTTMPQSSEPSDTAEASGLTPTTRRISKAKKGKRVHVCEHPECGKVFTRAEHQRRHQLNHTAEASFRCDIPGCQRSFHRQDLLARHKERHDSQQMRPNPSGLGEYSRQRSLSQTSTVSSEAAPSTMYTTSAPGRQSSMMPSVTEPLTSISSGCEMQSISGSGSINVSSTHLNVMSPLDNPYDQYSMVPPLYFESLEESPVESSNSCRSSISDYAGFHHPYVPQPPPYRSSSIASIAEPWPQAKYSPLSDTSTLPSLGEADVLSPPQPYIGSGHEGIFLQPVDPPKRFSTSELDGLDWYELRRGLVRAAGTMVAEDGLVRVNHERIHHCLECYWEHFHPVFPVIHQSTFADENSSPLLAAMMVAIGAQFSKTQHAKSYSFSMYQSCVRAFWKNRDQETGLFRLADMQTVILMEIYSRYRSRKATVYSSANFKTLYLNLLQDYQTQLTDPLTSLRALKSLNHNALKSSWYTWIDLETRRRLLLAAFIVDTQRATLYEQCYSLQFMPDLPFPCSAVLWNSQSATEWSRIGLGSQTLSLTDALELVSNHQISPDNFQSSLILAHLATQQTSPFEQELAFQSFYTSVDPASHTLLAYHATLMTRNVHVRDLLAVSGESWVFGQKIQDEPEWKNAKFYLRTWIDSDEAKKAVWHALAILRQYYRDNQQLRGLHEEWTIYLAVLVCWAFTFTIHIPLGTWRRPIAGLGKEKMQHYLLPVGEMVSWHDVRAVDIKASVRGMLEAVCSTISGPMGGLLDEAHGVLGKLAEGKSRSSTF